MGHLLNTLLPNLKEQSSMITIWYPHWNLNLLQLILLKGLQVTVGLVTVGISFAHSLNIAKNKEKGDSILIWGGATATGILAIQVAKLVYNLNVIVTAS